MTRARRSSQPSRRPQARAARPRGLLRDLLEDAERDRSSLARPVVSFHDGDDERYLAEIDRLALRKARLVRRGSDHGRVAELDPEAVGEVPPDARALRGERATRWHAARPIVLPGLWGDRLGELADEMREAARLAGELARPGGLRAWLAERAGALAPEFRAQDAQAPLADRERDLERVLVAGEGRDDLWLKSARLSTHEGDASLRLRVSFGEEGADDASGEEAAHAAVAELARRVLPGARALDGPPELAELLALLCGGPVRATQHLAYWNAPGGGARFHHDSFAEDERALQRGVLYAQLTGKTVWLALSIGDLALRVAEFLGALEDEGSAELVREIGGESARAELAGIAADEERAQAELFLPGCGRLAPIVDGSSAFTAWLADSGHAYLLAPGDAILLPNHGPRRTAMHAVFCASRSTGYALSAALRRVPDAEPA